MLVAPAQFPISKASQLLVRLLKTQDDSDEVLEERDSTSLVTTSATLEPTGNGYMDCKIRGMVRRATGQTLFLLRGRRDSISRHRLYCNHQQ